MGATPLSGITGVQVQLDGVWTDFPTDACKQVESNLKAGITKFGIQMKGNMYAIELTNDEGSQRNASSGTVRRVRVLRGASAEQVAHVARPAAPSKPTTLSI